MEKEKTEKIYQIEFSKEEKKRRVFNIDQELKMISKGIKELEKKGDNRKINTIEHISQILIKRKEKLEKEFEEEIKTLTEELPEDLIEAKEKIIKEGKEEFLENAKKYLEAQREIKELEEIIDIERFFSQLNPIEKSGIIKDCQDEIKELEDKIQEMENSCLEGFIAVNLIKIRELKRQLLKGIVEVPSVKQRIEEIKDYLSKGQIPFIYGETGTGKSEVAVKIARELSNQEPEVISGSEKTTYEELVGYLALTIGEEIEPSKIPELVNGYLEEFEESNPKMSSEEKEKHKNLIKEVLIKKFSERPTVTEIKSSRIFKALSEGKMIIIDEANMIPPGILAAFNRVFDEIRKRGVIKVPLTGEEIRIKEKEGFCGFILTGNITTTSTNRYKRFSLDPSLRDRVVMVPFNTPDQEVDPSKKHSDPQVARDLYTIGMISLLDRYGVLRAPENTPDQVWRLSQAFKTFQKAFAGESPLNIQGQTGDSSQVWPEKNHASIRKFLDIIQSWQKDGFQYDLDQYTWQYLIQPSLDTSQEAASFYQILQSIYDFFPRDKWSSEMPEIIDGQVRKFNLQLPLKDQLRSEKEIISFDFKTLIESLFAKKAVFEEEEKERKEKEKDVEKTMEMETSVRELKRFLDNEQEKTSAVCEIKIDAK